MSIFAPGTRVVIRDEELLVRRVDSSNDGGYVLSCDGISDLVRGCSVQFLTKLAEDITEGNDTALLAHGISSIDSTTRLAQKQFNRWLDLDDGDRNRLATLYAAAAQVDAERDAKLAALRDVIAEKCRNPINPGNRKVIVLTTSVFRDSAFADDVAKTNLAAILQQHGLEIIRSL